MNNIKGIIFDFDGTLFSLKHFSLKLVFSSLKNMFIMKDERDTRAIVRAKQFQNQDELIDFFAAEMAKKGHIKKEDFAFWYFKTYQDLMIKVLKNYKLRQKTDELFSFLIKNDIQYAFLSDYPRIDEKMRALSFKDEYIQKAKTITSCEVYGALKPNARAFLEVVKLFNLNKDECLVVGDKYKTDILGSINAGIPYIQIVEKKKKDPKDYQMTYEDFVKSIVE